MMTSQPSRLNDFNSHLLAAVLPPLGSTGGQASDRVEGNVRGDEARSQRPMGAADRPARPC